MMKIIFSIILITAFSGKRETKGALVNVLLNVQKSNWTNGPENFGINQGHSSLNGNWLKFYQRLGVNAARRFLNSINDLRKFIGASRWGQNLNGSLVSNQNDFNAAITSLRSSNGRNLNFPWNNPVKWSSIFAYMNTSRGIYGSDENALNQLISINISTLAVEHVGCKYFVFFSLDSSSPAYWSERWEFYKLSYAMAVWSYNKGIKMIEFYNEPDLDMGACLNVSLFIDYYKLRSLSIQNAYSDLNALNPLNQINVQILASAFAKKTYGGDVNQYLGDIVVKNRNYLFGNNSYLNSKWSNMQIYSYHTYGKTGASISSDLSYLKSSIQNDTLNNGANQIPVIITEHNSHTASDWDLLKTTSDDLSEASRLASQLINIIKSNVTSDYVFKFSVTADSSNSIKKNGIHWGEVTLDPYHISDTTTSAEAMRLLSQFKKSKVYSVQSNDTSSYRTYLASANFLDGYFYLYIVNDAIDTLKLNINITQLNVTQGIQIIVETVSDGYFGEVHSIITAPKLGSLLLLSINAYSTTRLAIPQSNLQLLNTISSIYSCTVAAGSQSNLSSCNSSIFIGTSNTTQHENTSVGLIKFPLLVSKINFQKTILKLNIQEILGNADVRLQILGVLAPKGDWNQTLASWYSLSNLTNGIQWLTPLISGKKIDSISKNFINWSSLSNIVVVGHVTIKSSDKNQTKMIDVSDYVKSVTNLGSNSISFLLYRPFIHPSYSTGAGSIPADNLSNGARVKISPANSAYQPQLIQYNSN